MKFHLIILLLTICISCKNNTEKGSESINTSNSNLVEEFQKELEKLSREEIQSIDRATALFQEYSEKTESRQRRDSMFMPYFEFYNIGRTLLLNENEKTIERYGFSKKTEKDVDFLVPIDSDYLKDNILIHLSNSMKAFGTQQLKEFNDVESLATIAQNTIWWENFNTKNPDFLLKDMTAYHYKNWHLANLLNGTSEASVFDEDGALTPNARIIYEKLLNDHPATETSQLITQYLALLKKSNYRKSEEINLFLKTQE